MTLLVLLEKLLQNYMVMVTRTSYLNQRKQRNILTGNDAMSYFVGGDVIDGGYDEDGGFAINGGKGWKEVVFTNHQIDLNGPVAIAMGSYVFTCATSGDVAKVEYTFGYKRNSDGKARIFLHHSSVPFQA